MPYTLGSLIRGGWKEISCLSHKKLQSLSVTKIFNELEEVDDFSKSTKALDIHRPSFIPWHIPRIPVSLFYWIPLYHSFTNNAFCNGIQSGMKLGLSNIVHSKSNLDIANKCVRHFLFTISNLICSVNPQNMSWVLFTISRFVISRFECTRYCKKHLSRKVHQKTKIVFFVNFLISLKNFFQGQKFKKEIRSQSNL